MCVSFDNAPLRRGAIILRAILLFIALISPSANCAQRDADYYNRKGVLYAKKGDISSAQAAFQEAIVLEPDNPYPYFNLGILAKRQGDYTQAINFINKALVLDKDMRQAYAVLVDIYTALGDFEEASKYAHTALEINEDSPQHIYNLGYAYLLEGDTALAYEQQQRLAKRGEAALAEKLLHKIDEKKGARRASEQKGR